MLLKASMFPSITSLVSKDISEAEHLHGQLTEFIPNLEEASILCVTALQQGGKIVLFGNGGSAADAQHIAAEFVGRFEAERAPLPAIALTTNTSVLTAIGNDYDFSTVFERQVKALVTNNDVAIGISTSGNSENVIKGILMANILGAKTIGLSGQEGILKTSVNLSLAVPSSHTPRIQEVHILLGHILTHAVETILMERNMMTADQVLTAAIDS
ncbi:SIS domain-containing protein [Patescibacteria group bacterium]|nr:SIS domain-containing protein [Patescibacteria group bacterium]